MRVLNGLGKSRRERAADLKIRATPYHSVSRRARGTARRPGKRRLPRGTAIRGRDSGGHRPPLQKNFRSGRKKSLDNSTAICYISSLAGRAFGPHPQPGGGAGMRSSSRNTGFRVAGFNCRRGVPGTWFSLQESPAGAYRAPLQRTGPQGDFRS